MFTRMFIACHRVRPKLVAKLPGMPCDRGRLVTKLNNTKYCPTKIERIEVVATHQVKKNIFQRKSYFLRLETPFLCIVRIFKNGNQKKARMYFCWEIKIFVKRYNHRHDPLILKLHLTKGWRSKIQLFTLYGGQFTFSTKFLTLNYLLYSPTDAAPQFL